MKYLIAITWTPGAPPCYVTKVTQGRVADNTDRRRAKKFSKGYLSRAVAATEATLCEGATFEVIEVTRG